VILAVGLDVVGTASFAEQLDDTASAFVDATFTASEQRAARGPQRALRLAGRYAAKEAFVKAWSGARAGRPHVLAAVDLREIEVVDDGRGRPALALHGEVAAAVALLDAGRVEAHLSISHDPPVAAAVVVLEAS
jgi:holo-[acyl-carrier protein] synthase